MRTGEGIELDRVRLRGARMEPTIARLRLSYLLSTASLTPRGMPPSAILLIRKMDDPLPGRIAADLIAGARATPEWEGAAQDRLTALLRSAARPIGGVVPPGAAAVLFQDYAEFLACVARDLSAGQAASWWMQNALPKSCFLLPASWVSVWAENSHYIPAALHHLEQRAQAITVLERIAPRQALNLLGAVLNAFGHSGLRHAILSAPISQPQPVTQPHPRFHPTEATAANPADPPSSPPPWEHYIAAATTPTSLGRERRALLGVCLLLFRAPEALSRASFAPRFRAWMESELIAAPPPPTSQDAVPAPHPSRVLSPFAAPQRDRRHQPGAVDLPALLHTAPPPAQPISFSDLTTHQSPPSAAQTAVTPSVAPRWDAGEPTRAGGVLYLIHLLLQSELLRHFDVNLSGWAAIELLARCFLENRRDLLHDAIWPALATLDGRDLATPPAAEFEPRAVYAAPALWLDRCAPARLLRFRARGFELWTPESILALDESSAGQRPPAFSTPSRSQHRRFARAARANPLGLEVHPPLRRFLHFFLPYARWRLQCALRKTPIESALGREGRLYLSATHVDLVMPMRQISVPVRLAGLDANPGWVPALGRVIHFHFESEGF